jgi:hypothetical protein
VLGYKQSFFFIVIIYLQLPLHYFERNAKDKMGPLINDHYVLLPFQPISEKVHEAFVGLWLEQSLRT